MKISSYFESLTKEVDVMYKIAIKCRRKWLDPEDKVDIVLARDVSERVEGLVGSLQPIIIGKGIPIRIKELETKYSAGDWRIALVIAEEVASNKFGEFSSQQLALETGIRVGLAYLTLGIVSAPLEGFVELKIKQRMDGKQYLSCFFSGPIRAAGGTAAAVCLVIADYLGKKFNYDRYDPTKEEIERYISEIDTYHSRIARLQYLPDDEEIKIVLKNLHVEINGDPTSKREVLMHKYLPRVETPYIRGGMCLVFGEGLCQKAKKIMKNIDKWGKDFGMSEWVWINELLDYKEKKYSSKEETTVKLVPSSQYIEEAVAGRPIFGYPSRHGGFRLRYGRSRVSGIAAASMHPATMAVLNNFIATGSQLKLERPGKACIATPCDSIDGPIVILKDGSMIKIETEKQANELLSQIKRIPFIGDILLNYGDFVQFASILAPSAYVPEWWVLNAKDKQIPLPEAILNNPTKHEIRFEDAIKLSKEYGVPLHPNFLFCWSMISLEELKLLLASLKNSVHDGVLKIEKSNDIKPILEKLLVLHKSAVDYYLVEPPLSTALLYQVGYLPSMSWKEISESSTDALSEINKLCEFKIMDTVGTPIGARMGRPEKAKIRKLKGSPQGIFPCGKEGGRMRNLVASFDLGYITSNFPVLFCGACNKETIYNKCEACGSKTNERLYCEVCTQSVDTLKHCGKDTVYYKTKKIDAKQYINSALKNLGVGLPELVKGVKGTWSKKRIPEHIEKAILRAMHDVYVNKDGTIRYDMIEAPITHFKPSEIGTSVEKLKELGYEAENEGQVIPIMPQDIILPDCPDLEEARSPAMLIRVCNFLDDLLVKFYNEPKFYNVKKKEDLIGQLVIGLAPHTSAGIVGRIIGFSQTQGFYAHPYYHAAMRRNCLTSDSVIYFKNSRNLHSATMEEFFDRYTDKIKITDFYGTEEIDLSNKTILSLSTDKSGNYTEKKIVKAYRRKHSGNILRITTRNNHEIKVTPEHRLWVFDATSNQLVEKIASELKEGDLLASLNKVSSDQLMLDYIDNLSLLYGDLEENCINVRTSKIFCETIIKNLGGTKQAKEKLNLSKQQIYNIFYRKPYSIPLPIFRKLNVPFEEYSKFNLGFKRNFGWLPVLFDTGKFAKFLGYYISDGCAWISKVKNKNSWHINIAVTKDEVRSDIITILNFLKINYSTFENTITITNKLLYKLLIEKLKIGSNAYKKQIPDFVLNCPDNAIYNFLGGLYQGDGNVYKREIKYTTVSEKLASQLSFLLTKIGLTPSFRIERNKEIKSGLVFEKYKSKGRLPPKTTLHYVCLGSTDAELFASKIKLADEKGSKLEKINTIKKNRRLELHNNIRLTVIKQIVPEVYDGYVYDIQLEKGDKIFAVGKGQLLSHNCDGDESSVMMLLDGLLNFSRQFLPDSRGSRSVTSDTIIYLEENGKIKCSRIGDYIDEQFKNKGYRVDLDGYEILDNNEDINAISFDKNRTAKFCKISKFIRHINDKEIYRIKTSNGYIKTTEDHSLFTVREGEITAVKASELKKGDEILTLAKLKIPKSITEEVNVLDLLDSEELYIVPEKHNLEKIKAIKAVVAKYGNNFYRYQNGTRAAPLKFYNDANVRPNCRVRLKSHSKSIPYKIKLDEDFFKLLGFIYAEGHIKQNGEIEIGSTSPEIIEHISKVYENLFYRQPTIGADERKDKYTNGSYYRIYLPAVFGKLLFKLGIKPQKAKNKEVPAIVYRSSDENISAFIYGHFLGDGSVKDDYLILHTASEKLASGLSLLPYVIGGKSSISKTKGMYAVRISRYKQYSKYETKVILSNIRKNTGMNSASKHKILELASQTNGDVKESDLRVERVVKIEELNYDGYVYDLEVPDNQNFLCGPHPIFAHNSMDAPLVLTTVLVPSEVDDEVHNLDVSNGYPIELYENSLKLKYPWDINNILQIKQFLGKEEEYSDVGYTHPVSSINLGPKVSAYKTLATMMDKVEKQMELAEKIDAVNESDVASMIIEKHFLKDIKGNLRRFGSQNVRCVECNEKYRRVTMSGVCTKCKGKLILTVAHGTVTKYIEPSEMLINKYNVPPYLKQVFETIKRSIESVFKVESKKQTKLMNF